LLNEAQGVTLTLYNLNYFEGQSAAQNVAQDVTQGVAQEEIARRSRV